MKLQSVIAAAWVVGMLLAPDNLILLGNSVGSNGVSSIFLVSFAMLVFIAHSRCYEKITTFRKGAAGEYEWITAFLNPVAGVIFSIAPRVLAAVFLAIATLVASGFVFNEVFVQRFPNFAFAFLMLGALLAINLFSRGFSEKIQLIFSGTALAGIIILATAGIFEWLKTCQIVYTLSFIPPLGGAFSVLLLFVGFDLLNFMPIHGTKQSPLLQRNLFIGLLVVGIVFCFWGIASILYIPGERLADTYIPHLLAAKKIGGQTGRVIMGLVIICGTGAAVNALFMAVSRMMSDLSRRAFLPFLPRVFSRSSVTLTLLTLITAIAMAFGVAGTDELDTYIRGSMILWLLNYALVHLVFLIAAVRRLPNLYTTLSGRQTAVHGAIFMLMATGALILIATDDNTGLLIRYLGIIFVGVGLPVWLLERRHFRNRQNHISENS